MNLFNCPRKVDCLLRSFWAKIISQGSDLFRIQKAIDAKRPTNECSLKHGNDFGKAIEVDQKPIGKTSRSTPVTYLGVWDRIRGSFAKFKRRRLLV